MVLAWIVGACLAGTLLSLAIAVFVASRVQQRWIPTLVSFAVGALLGVAFLDLLPHLFEQTKAPARTASFILGGILAFFMLEKLLLWRHHHHHGEEGDEHGEAAVGPVHGHDDRRVGWMIVLGDAFHNVTDGVIIAGAFLADLRLGIVTSLAIIAHEIPQEIGDFVILLHSGYSKAAALALNLASSLAMLVGALLAYFTLQSAEQWIATVLALAAASMIYVAVADLIPGLHRRPELRATAQQVTLIALGVGLIWLVGDLVRAA